MPASWKEAKLTLILKRGKDHMHPESYHPISLLNMDYKILTTILADRLNRVIGNYVVDDQTGFIRGRYLKENIRREMNIVDMAQRNKKSRVLLFWDAEKAFDITEWIYLNHMINRFGIVSYFGKWLNI